MLVSEVKKENWGDKNQSKNASVFKNQFLKSRGVTIYNAQKMTRNLQLKK